MSGPVATLDERSSDLAGHADGVRSMFDRIAPTYDRLNRILSAGTDVLWRRKAVAAAIARAPSGPMLDLCAGTMDMTALLARARPGQRLVAADFSAAMLDAGKEKAPAAERRVADALHLPFDDGEFSVVTCAFGVRNLADPLRGAREARRVLRPGGVFAVLEFFRPERLVTRAFHSAYARAVLPAVGGAVSGDRRAYAYLAESMRGFLTRGEYEKTLTASGFKNVEARDLSFGVASVVHAVAGGTT